MIGEMEMWGALTIYLQWRKAGGKLFRVAVTEKNQASCFFFSKLFFYKECERPSSEQQNNKHEGVTGNCT